MNILYLLLFLLAPAGVLWLCRRVKILGKIGPVLILYFLGLVVGNIGWKPSGLPALQDTLTNVTVPLAIPLMLFGCTFRRSETRSQLLALVTGLVAVVIAVFAGFLIFGRSLDDGAKVGGMLTGVYTGGTVNLASLQAMLAAPEETFVLMNSCDVVVSFLYLVFLMAAGVKLFRRWLPNQTNVAASADDCRIIGEAVSRTQENPYKGLLSRSGLRDIGIQIGTAAVIIAVSGGLGLLCSEDAFMTVFILTLTALSIAASFLKFIRGRRYGYDVGMYFIYIFSMTVASMADFGNLDLGGSLNLLGYLALAVFGSLLLQVLMARIFRIDSDTMVISSVAFICSPPFVPMMAGAMKNRRVLASGLAIGVFGYAAGNYLGYLMFRLLSLL